MGTNDHLCTICIHNFKKKSLKATSAYDWTCSNTDWFFDAISTLPQEIDALFPYSYRSRAL